MSTRAGPDGTTVALLAVPYAHAHAAAERARALGLEHGLLGHGSDSGQHWEDTATRKRFSTLSTGRTDDTDRVSDKVRCPQNDVTSC